MGLLFRVCRMVGYEDEFCVVFMWFVFVGDGLVMGVGMIVLVFCIWIKFWLYLKVLKDIKDILVICIVDLCILVEELDV